MASFDYRLNPLYPIKECSSCGALYTKNYCCSEGSLKDKIIYDLNKTPDLSQRPPHNCPKCENPVDGHYCQRCALLRKKFKKDLFTYCIENGTLQDFQDASEPSNDNTNIVNTLQDPFVVEQDLGKNSSQSPPQINHHCCYGCGDSSNHPDPEPFNNQTIDELPQTLLSFDPTCYSEDENSFTYDSKSNLVDDSPNVCDPPSQPPLYSYKFCGNDARYGHYCTPQEEEKRIKEEQAAKARYRKIPICYSDDDDEDCTIKVTPILSTEEPDNSLMLRTLSQSDGIPENMCDVLFHDNSPPLDVSKDQFEDFSDSNDDSTSIDDDSFSTNNIEYVEASPPDFELVSLEVVEIVIREVGGIDDDILLTIKDDILREKLLNINLLIANIEALKDNPTPSFDFMTKSSSTFLNFLLEETNTFDNSLPESKTFCFDLEEISSGSTITRFDISIPDDEAFYDDHVKEISSGITTTHFDSSLYDSFIFDLSINPFPPVDRSDFYEFADELAHIIALSEYDCFCFKNEPNMDVVEDIFPTRDQEFIMLCPPIPPFN
uniref:Pre-mRNA splicing Prp18-interacting factor n=1 Tax=Tanacetum cinerariifolium TaxID=118510 RepID=A0A699GQ59_TANCI|nr:hypothetical protein [Tanacetum cinerariifolium]